MNASGISTWAGASFTASVSGTGAPAFAVASASTLEAARALSGESNASATSSGTFRWTASASAWPANPSW